MNFKTADEAFEYFFDLINKMPDEKNGTRLIKNVSFTISNPTQNLIHQSYRKWKKEYAELEYAWYKTGNKKPTMVETNAKLWLALKDKNGEVNSNYGYWWKRNGQLDNVISILRLDHDSRRALLVHYSPDEVQNYGLDTPCNICVNFHVENEKLCITVFARSIDLVYGFCNDQYCFSELQKEVAIKLDLPVGSFHYFITNLHIYKKHFNLKSK